MAIYHMSAQVIGRSSGRSSVAAAAYRAAERLMDIRTGEIHDYTKKKGVDHTEILRPENCGEWACDRSTLWNKTEATERRSDAQLAREINIAIPKELTTEQGRFLVREYAQNNFVAYGMIADICIHGENTGNPHAHIMLSMREVEGQELGKKVRAWNDKKQLETWREEWAHSCNKALERAGRNVRIDNRSYAEQGIDKEAMIHLGPQCTAMERKGKRTARGDRNREIRRINAIRKGVSHLDAHIYKLREQYKAISAHENVARYVEDKNRSITTEDENYKALKERFTSAQAEYVKLKCSSVRFLADEISKARSICPEFEKLSCEDRASYLADIKDRLDANKDEKRELLKEQAAFNAAVDNMGFVKKSLNAGSINAQGRDIDRRIYQNTEAIKQYEHLYKSVYYLDEMLRVDAAIEAFNYAKNELETNPTHLRVEEERKREIKRAVQERLAQRNKGQYRGR